MKRNREYITIIFLMFLINMISSTNLIDNYKMDKDNRALLHFEKELTNTIGTCSMYTNKVLASTIFTGLIISQEMELSKQQSMWDQIRKINEGDIITAKRSELENEKGSSPSYCY